MYEKAAEKEIRHPVLNGRRVYSNFYFGVSFPSGLGYVLLPSQLLAPLLES